MQYDSYDCAVPKPTDCGTIILPAVKFATCAAAYQAHESEICDVWIVMTADGIANERPNAAMILPEGAAAGADDWLNPENYPQIGGGWTGDAATMLHLTTIGDKPLSEINEITVAKRWLVFTSRTHTVNIDITDMSVENYDFIRALQVKPTVAIWYRDIDGYMYGGEDGVVCDIQNAGNILNRGEGGLLTGQAVFTWEADCDPPVGEESSALNMSAPMNDFAIAPPIEELMKVPKKLIKKTK